MIDLVNPPVHELKKHWIERHTFLDLAVTIRALEDYISNEGSL